MRAPSTVRVFVVEEKSPGTIVKCYFKMVQMEIGRKVFKDLWREIEEPEVLILTGPRQVGKTTLMRALEASAESAGMKTRFLDLEQPADLASLTGGRQEIIDTLVLGVDIVFVDEFYYPCDPHSLAPP
jgi:predicted AAA+ superfamily ATPase